MGLQCMFLWPRWWVYGVYHIMSALDKLKNTKIIIAMYIDVEKAREF